MVPIRSPIRSAVRCASLSSRLAARTSSMLNRSCSAVKRVRRCLADVPSLVPSIRPLSTKSSVAPYFLCRGARQARRVYPEARLEQQNHAAHLLLLPLGTRQRMRQPRHRLEHLPTPTSRARRPRRRVPLSSAHSPFCARARPRTPLPLKAGTPRRTTKLFKILISYPHVPRLHSRFKGKLSRLKYSQ